MSIGKAAELTGVRVPTIRYYEAVKLLPTAPRAANNRRTFDDADVRRLRFIRHSRELGFDVDAVRQLLALAGLPEQPCDEAYEVARARLVQVKGKISVLRAFKRELQGMIDQGKHGSIREPHHRSPRGSGRMKRACVGSETPLPGEPQ